MWRLERTAAAIIRVPAAALGTVGIIVSSLGVAAIAQVEPEPTTAEVLRVVDGDTVDIRHPGNQKAGIYGRVLGAGGHRAR
jgi:endonuclease YncB( thermonuclease family)